MENKSLAILNSGPLCLHSFFPAETWREREREESTFCAFSLRFRLRALAALPTSLRDDLVLNCGTAVRTIVKI